MKADVAGAYLILSFGLVFIGFGTWNLVVDPAIGVLSLAAMAVVFGGLLAAIGVFLRTRRSAEAGP